MNIVQGTLTVESIADVARDTKKFVFSSNPEFTFQAGQFLSLQFGENAWRAYSIASSPSEGRLEFVVRFVEGGLASKIWWETKVGDQFPFKGPFGAFTLSEKPKAQFVFCATGTGVAPFRSMILTENKSPNPRPMTLLYGGQNEKDLAYIADIATWSPHLRVCLGLSRQDDCEQKHYGTNVRAKNCRITEFLETENFGPESEFYVCGSGPMVKSVNELLESQGVPKSQIHQERFN